MKCENCGKEHDGSYGSGRFCSNHCRHVFIGKQTKVHKCNFKNTIAPFGTWTCKFCGSIFGTRTELWKHYHEKHGDKLCGLHGKGQVAWNKGLTKDFDSRVRQGCETLHERYASGEIKGSFSGKHHSQQTKDKCRETALKSNHQRVCKKKQYLM